MLAPPLPLGVGALSYGESCIGPVCVNSIDPIRLIMLVDGSTMDRGRVIIINSSLSQPLEQFWLRNDHRGPRLAEYEGWIPTPPHMGNKFNQPPLPFSSSIVLVNGWTVDRSCVTIINPSLSQPLGFIIVM